MCICAFNSRSNIGIGVSPIPRLILRFFIPKSYRVKLLKFQDHVIAGFPFSKNHIVAGFSYLKDDIGARFSCSQALVEFVLEFPQSRFTPVLDFSQDHVVFRVPSFQDYGVAGNLLFEFIIKSKRSHKRCSSIVPPMLPFAVQLVGS